MAYRPIASSYQEHNVNLCVVGLWQSVADVWIEIYSGIARFLCDSMALVSARQHVQRALSYRPFVRPSIRMSVCHTGGSVKTVEVGLCNFHRIAYQPSPQPIPLVFAGYALSGKRSPHKRWHQTKVAVRKTNNFQCINVSKMVRDSPKLLWISNKKLHYSLSIGIKIGDLGRSAVSSNFVGISHDFADLRDKQWRNEWKSYWSQWR